jgi:hypothetical protein
MIPHTAHGRCARGRGRGAVRVSPAAGPAGTPVLAGYGGSAAPQATRPWR